MEALRRVLRARRKQLLSLDNVIGVGAGHKSVRGESTGKNAIVVIVKKKLPAEKVKQGHLVPESLEGIDTDVIETGEFRFLASTDRLRPAPPGVSIGHYKVTAGTFGAVVRDNATGRLLILSNNHVLANATDGTDGRAKAGDPVLQPGVIDGGSLEEDIIGELLRFVPVYSTVRESQCPIAKAVAGSATRLLKLFKGDYMVRFFKENDGGNIVDAAVARPLEDRYVTSSVPGLGEISGSGEVEIGQVVRKSGRTSGLTEGKVRVTDVSVNVNLGTGNIALFTDQVMSDMVSKPGDSGSIVLDEENRAVGLLFAGSNNMTLFNKFSNVEKLLDISL